MSSPAPHRTSRDLALAVGAAGASALLYFALAGRSSDAEALAFFGRLHPLAVHLPIGIVLLAGALEGLSFSPRLRARTDPARALILRLALASAVAALALGLLLAGEGGHPERLLAQHRRLTFAFVVATAVSLATWSLHEEGRVPRVAHRLAMGATLGLLGLGAHFGGSMTHGEGYLVRYAPAFLKGAPSPQRRPSTTEPSRDRLVFEDVVLPVLERRCGSCHGVEAAKGQLRLHTFDALMTGGKSGPAITAGDAKRSLLVERIELPLSDDAHMPPEGKPQLTPGEIELVSLWIDRGASPEATVRELLVPDGARRLLVEAQSRVGAPAALASAEPEPAALASAEPEPAAAPSPTEPQTTAPPRTATNDGAALEVLAAKCGRCHGARRQKGKLRTDSLGALLAGGVSGPAIVPGAPGRGTLFERIRLPIDDDLHMPPREEAQLSAEELRLLTSWVTRRAASAAPPQRNGEPSDVPPALLAAPAGPETDSPAADEQRQVPNAGARLGAPTVHGGCAGCAAHGDAGGGRLALAFGSLLLARIALRRRSRGRLDHPNNAT